MRTIGRCAEVEPETGWQCNRRRGHEDDHQAVDPGGPFPEMDGCLIVGDDTRERRTWR